ncbi:MAG: EAL domain-containing protein [Candidatus Izemoplasmataceae bacterium]
MKPKHTSWIGRLLSDRPKFHLSTLVFIIISLPLTYLLVYTTGGIKYVYSHTMYLPIIVAAVVFGLKGGLIVAIIGGILLGPFMPIEVTSGEIQPLANWLYRLLAFSIVGSFVGYVSGYLRNQIKIAHQLSNLFPETNLPNYKSYTERYDEHKRSESDVAITMNINNYEDIVALLGREIYIEVVKDIYAHIKSICPNIEIIQIDYRKLWIIMHQDMYKENFKPLLKYFETDVHYHQSVTMFVDVSLGVCICDSICSYTIIEAFRASEIAAMYAKNKQLRYVVYQEEFSHESLNLERLGALPNAVLRDELFMEYHPIIDNITGKVNGLEALVRWRYKGEIVPPLDFIPVAEETKLIDLITEWIVNKVSSDYEEIAQGSAMTIYINISQRNLYNPRLIERIIETIKVYNKTHKAIGIEMTESTLMLNIQLTKALLQTIKENNIPNSIDDFGTGYSTLFALNELPIDHIKLDREVITGIEKTVHTQKLVKMIIAYAHDLNLKVIAEGVETIDVYEMLKTYKCDGFQGYYFTKALPKLEIIEWIKTYNLNR